jgi:hypothetical protein
MNPKAEIWNVLHDGTLSDISGTVPGDIRLKIEIPYLRDFFHPAGKSFLVDLQDCTEFRMIREQGSIGDLSKIIVLQSSILSTESEDCPVKIATTEGELELSFASSRLSLDTGEPITHEELCEACERYWENFGKRQN